VEFVVKKYTVVYAPSTPALVELDHSKRAKTPASLLVFADPVYSGRAPRSSPSSDSSSDSRGSLESPKDPLRDLGLGRLGHTRVEASQIASLFSGLATSAPATAAEDALGIQAIQNGLRNHHLSASGFELFLGPEATVDKFCDRAPRYSILHLAAHGLESAPGYGDPILALSPVDGRTSVLSCAQILQLNLCADLVVLAACDSARGRKIRGDGIHSLARAFLHAGARGVVASLWEARDLQAGELMRKFYQKILQGPSPPAEALRQVKLDMLAGDASRGISPGPRDEFARRVDSSDPYFWASFVLIGSGE
jgi:hypothetical protein